MTRAVVALGSNVPPRRAALREAVARLARLPDTRLLATSDWHRSEPVDPPPGVASGEFLNGACLLETALSPRAFVDALLAIEAALGRVRTVRNAPRTIDLDLVVHGDAVVDEPGLTVPHPRAHERPFVLEPAAQVAPDLRHPVLGRTLAELRDALRARGPDGPDDAARAGDRGPRRAGDDTA